MSIENSPTILQVYPVRPKWKARKVEMMGISKGM